MTDRSTSQDSIKLLKRDAILKSLQDVPTELMEEIGTFYNLKSIIDMRCQNKSVIAWDGKKMYFLTFSGGSSMGNTFFDTFIKEEEITKIFPSAGIYLAQKMSPEKRDELIEAIQKIGDREEKSESPSPSVSEGEVSP